MGGRVFYSDWNLHEKFYSDFTDAKTSRHRADASMSRRPLLGLFGQANYKFNRRLESTLACARTMNAAN